MSNPKNLLNDTIKLFGLKADRETALSGFYAFQGVLAGIALNDIWQFLALPGNGKPVTRADGTKVGDFDMDFLYQAAIGGLLIAGEVLFGIKHAAAAGGGVILGSRWANTSEKGQYIGNAAVPFL
jgi:hypothetical protein